MVDSVKNSKQVKQQEHNIVAINNFKYVIVNATEGGLAAMKSLVSWLRRFIKFIWFKVALETYNHNFPEMTLRFEIGL